MIQDTAQRKLALLIDADNTQPAVVADLLAEVAKYGIASVRRIYGDWTSPQLRGWKAQLLEHAIQPIQQFSYTSGKNATDSAMIIDAMDLLFTGRFDGFCLVTSDSDFTRLAARIREAGLTVYGFGERKTPKPFVGACDKFIYLDILRAPPPEEDDEEAHEERKRKSGRELKQDSKLVTLLRAAVEDAADESGWADLGLVGQHIANQAPEFDPRNYGFRKLIEVMQAIELFRVDARPNVGAPGRRLFVQDKRRK